MRKKWVSKLRKGNRFVIYTGLRTTATTTTTTTKFNLNHPSINIGFLVMPPPLQPPHLLLFLHRHHHISIEFFSYHHHHHIYIAFPPLLLSPLQIYKSLQASTISQFFMPRVLKTQPWFPLILSCFSCSTGPVSLSDSHSTTNPCIKPNPIKVR